MAVDWLSSNPVASESWKFHLLHQTKLKSAAVVSENKSQRHEFAAIYDLSHIQARLNLKVCQE